VEATFDFVERTKFQRKTRSTLLPFLATKSNVASTLLLVWTGLYGFVDDVMFSHNGTTCDDVGFGRVRQVAAPGRSLL